MSFEALHRELRHWKGEAVCQVLAEYLVVTILELYGQEEGHNSIDFFTFTIPYLFSSNTQMQLKYQGQEGAL